MLDEYLEAEEGDLVQFEVEELGSAKGEVTLTEHLAEFKDIDVKTEERLWCLHHSLDAEKVTAVVHEGLELNPDKEDGEGEVISFNRV
ncbi:hypothetical protein [Halosimplex carlsbadense]|uniref:hypothetical protein n=1 Tax=Halosimplex carlsbadense TaxID=171164 RepID=UPI001268FFE7|nr:hypothetical protein [Halosimplex carlsbadense]